MSHALLVAVGSTLPRGWRPSGSRLARGGSPRSNRYRFEGSGRLRFARWFAVGPGAALFRGCFADGGRRVRSWLGSPSFDLSLSRLLHAWIKFRSSLFCARYATGRFVAVLSDSPVLRVSGSLMAVAAGSDRGRSRVPSLPIPGRLARGCDVGPSRWFELTQALRWVVRAWLTNVSNPRLACCFFATHRGCCLAIVFYLEHTFPRGLLTAGRLLVGGQLATRLVRRRFSESPALRVCCREALWPTQT